MDDFFKMGMLFQARKKVHVYIIPCMIHRGVMKSELNRQRNDGMGSLGKYYLEKGEAKVVLDDGEVVRKRLKSYRRVVCG